MALRKTRTDRLNTLAADEFLWDIDGHVEAHAFLKGPLLDALRLQGAKDVLDLGCGNGSLTALLHENGFRMTGLDHSRSGIASAQARYPGIRFDRFDSMEPLPRDYRDAFDAVVSVEVIEHLLLPRKLFERSLEALRPGGLAIVTTLFHGYWKNLALAVTGRFDDHWHPVRDFGPVKFFSRRTLTHVFEEFSLQRLSFRTTGRIPPFARSMMLSGQIPK